MGDGIRVLVDAIYAITRNKQIEFRPLTGMFQCDTGRALNRKTDVLKNNMKLLSGETYPIYQEGLAY